MCFSKVLNIDWLYIKIWVVLKGVVRNKAQVGRGQVLSLHDVVLEKFSKIGPELYCSEVEHFRMDLNADRDETFPNN